MLLNIYIHIYILPYPYIYIWTLTKRLEKKLDGNYTRMLRAILDKSRQQHPTRHQLYGHLPPITKTIQARRTRHAGHCWRSKDELVSDVLLWTPAYGQSKAGRPARTYIQQLREDTGCSPEDLPGAMNDREKWRERVRDIRAGRTTWWWYTLLPLYIYIYILPYPYIYTPLPLYIYILPYPIYTPLPLYIYILPYIYSPTPLGLSSLANEVIVLPLAFIASLFIYELWSR